MDCCLAQSWGSENCVIIHLEPRGSDNQFSFPPSPPALRSSISPQTSPGKLITEKPEADYGSPLGWAGGVLIRL